MLSRSQWLRCATLGLVACVLEREDWWRGRAGTLDRLASDLAGELGAMKPLAADPLFRRAMAREAQGR